MSKEIYTHPIDSLGEAIARMEFITSTLYHLQEDNMHSEEIMGLWYILIEVKKKIRDALCVLVKQDDEDLERAMRVLEGRIGVLQAEREKLQKKIAESLT